MRRLVAVVVSVPLFLSAVQTVPTGRYTSVRTLVIEGHGWGHALGMPQWGARGMAEAGYRSDAILHHYYTGVRIARARENIRVRVLLRRINGVRASSARPFRVLVGGRIVRARGSEWFRVFLTRKRTRVERSSSPAGPWRYVASTVGSVTFARSGAPFRITQTGGQRFYRGNILLRRSGGALDVINDLPVEQYLLGVVPREMPASWSRAALQAQAVAARTYALRVRQLARARRNAWDICASTACQVYGGVGRWTSSGKYVRLEDARASAAVHATRGEVLTYRGHLITAFYASSSGGLTQQGNAPYLRAVSDPYDRGSPLHSWRITVPVTTIERGWPAIGHFRGVRVVARDGRGEWGGRVKQLVLIGTSRSIRVSGSAFERTLGLRSRWFIVRPEASAESYVFRNDFGYGSRSRAVLELQRRLLAGGYFPRNVTPSGFFGHVTEDSVRRYQRAHRIQPTGYVGPKTRHAMNVR